MKRGSSMESQASFLKKVFSFFHIILFKIVSDNLTQINFNLDFTKNPSRAKVNTKNQLAKKEIKRSMEVSGEIDVVKRTESQLGKDKSKLVSNLSSTLSKNGINLSQEQLAEILNTIQNEETPNNQKFAQRDLSKERKPNAPMNLNLSGDDMSSYKNYQQRPQKDSLNDLPAYRQPKIVVNQDELESKSTNNLDDQASNKHFLIDKKKQKWQKDKGKTF